MKGGIMYNQKEIVIIPFPYSDLTGAKQRPAIIISNKTINNTEDRICCLITSNPSKEGLLITDKNFYSGKLPFKSWVKTHRLFTIHSGVIKKKLCTVTDDFHNQIINKINEHIKKD